MGLFSYTKEKEIRLKIKQIAYYIVIGFISVIAVVILPLLNSSVDLRFEFPNTVAGWTVYIITRASIAAINILFYFCFMSQAKINVAKDERYLKAREILEKANIDHERKPKSPAKWTAQQYTTKTLTLTLTSVLSTIALTTAILSFDLAVFLAYFFTIIMGLIFGFIQMKKAEDYWTDEFYEYALLVQKEQENQKNSVVANNLSQKKQNVEKSAKISPKGEK